MKIKRFLCIAKTFIPVLVLFISNTGSAQIEITSNNLLSLLGTSQNLDVDQSGSIMIDVGAAGANQVWDFTFAMPQANKVSREFVTPAGTPFAVEFPAANWVVVLKYPSAAPVAREFERWDYWQVTGSGLSQIGGGIVTVAPDSSYLFFRALQSTITLPLVSGSTWVDKLISFTGDTTASGTAIDITSTSTVDSWGLARLPIGDFDCLRVRNENVEIFRQFSGGNVVSVDTTTKISYHWVTTDNYTVAVAESQFGETDTNFTDAALFSRITSRALPTGVAAQDDAIPTNFELLQNYPNPFNPATTIQFDLPITTQVELIIYNSLGQQVRTLLDGGVESGRHEIVWDGRGNFGQRVASGMYFLQIHAISRTSQIVGTRKMLLLQ